MNRTLTRWILLFRQVKTQKVQRPALLPNPNPPLAGLDRVAHDINIPGGSLDLPAIRPAKGYLGKNGNLCYTIGSRQIEPGR